jgi:hypothetical protein
LYQRLSAPISDAYPTVALSWWFDTISNMRAIAEPFVVTHPQGAHPCPSAGGYC